MGHDSRASVQRILGESPNKPPRIPVDPPEAQGAVDSYETTPESRVLIVNRARPREPAPAAGAQSHRD
jgi:hypothetical protein